jgi:hypothetical protein
MKKREEFEKTSTIALIKKQTLLEKAIWRLEANIKKKDAPMLDESRHELISRHHRELTIIRRILKDRK